MQYVSFRDLQNIAPSTLRKKLTSEGALMLTVGNRPIATMICLDGTNVQDALLTVSQMRAQMAARAIRSQARKDGLNEMSLKEVNALINKTRFARRS